ncbi:iron chelate uptake ABC transporter family permease subunit, partial [Vreelandella massiliensis]|uniref:iron chelate uptake ABC transporter family permease subunit n=1 Tax=Vreelandella massiliensis TaxID=1816686 RepID=UPI001181C5B0
MHARAQIGQKVLVALTLLSAAMLVFSTTVGPMSIMWQDSLRVLLGMGSASGGAHLDTIITSIRLPRALLGMLVGAALAASGAAIQGPGSFTHLDVYKRQGQAASKTFRNSPRREGGPCARLGALDG